MDITQLVKVIEKMRNDANNSLKNSVGLDNVDIKSYQNGFTNGIGFACQSLLDLLDKVESC